MRAETKQKLLLLLEQGRLSNELEDTCWWTVKHLVLARTSRNPLSVTFFIQLGYSAYLEYPNSMQSDIAISETTKKLGQKYQGSQWLPMEKKKVLQWLM